MKNILKEKLQKGQAVIGTFVRIGHPDVTERLSRIGFDFLVLDGEHGRLSIETMQVMMQAMNGSNCIPLVRPQWNDMVIIKRVLDIGACGVIIPWVNTKMEAEYAVRACKYPPEGIRGCGPRRASLFDPDYIRTANDEILVVAQIETKTAVDNIDDILSVRGIDACFIGPMDLALNFGFYGTAMGQSPYTGAFDKVLKAAKKCGKPAGMAADNHCLEWAIDKGFKLCAVGNDDIWMVQGATMVLDKARDAIKKIA